MRQHEYPIPDLLLESIPGYLERKDQDALDLESAVQRNDFSTIQTISHKLIGSGASYGFANISELGNLLQKTCASKDIQEASTLVQSLRQELIQIRKSVLSH